MTTAEARVAEVAATINKYAPGYRLAKKSASPLMRVLGRIFALMGSDFAGSFWTTLPRLDGGSTTYLPTSTDAGAPDYEWWVIVHEGVHAQQSRAMSRLAPLATLLYAALYLLPFWAGVACALYGVAALIAGLPLWPAIGAVLAAPLPAPWRARWELDAYEADTAAIYWYRGGMTPSDVDAQVADVVSDFTGWAYYRMWAFGKSVDAKMRATIAELGDGSYAMTPYMTDIRALAERYRAEDA